MPSSDGLIVVEAAPREVVLLALGLLRTGRALGRGGCCAGGGGALALKMAHFPIQMRSLAFEDQ